MSFQHTLRPPAVWSFGLWLLIVFLQVNYLKNSTGVMVTDARDRDLYIYSFVAGHDGLAVPSSTGLSCQLSLPALPYQR